jgi:hypothetical protein
VGDLLVGGLVLRIPVSTVIRTLSGPSVVGALVELRTPSLRSPSRLIRATFGRKGIDELRVASPTLLGLTIGPLVTTDLLIGISADVVPMVGFSVVNFCCVVGANVGFSVFRTCFNSLWKPAERTSEDGRLAGVALDRIM